MNNADLCVLKDKVASLQIQLYNLSSLIKDNLVQSIRKEFIAGDYISGGKAVMVDTDRRIYPYDISNPYHYDKYVGIAETGAIPMEPCTVVLEGISTVLGSGWSAGVPYYIGSNSLLTQVIPEEGNLLKLVGVGIDVNTILINNDFDIITQ